MDERRRDPYYRRAKREGYRSRSAFKLKQIDTRFNIFKDAKKVLDLGAAPGGWLQVASEEIPEDGLVLGVDLKEIESLEIPNVRTIVGDITEEKTQVKILEILGEKVDVILSDLAPDVSGNWDLDQYRQIYLARMVLVLADRLLSEEGWLVVKTFEGSEFMPYVQDVRAMFVRVNIVKPRASRKESAENYVVARFLKTNRMLPDEFREDN